MKVYQAEIDAGLGDFFKSTYGSIKCEALVEEFKHEVKPEILDRIAKATNMGQMDLFYARSILASTGWNKNTDVLLKSEAWSARHTAEDKPFNFEHNESDIIGHSTSNYVLDDDFNVISDDTKLEDLPSRIHIATAWVLYKHWEKKELLERMQKIIAEIGEKKWYVSMEALFPDFDYAIITPEGKEYTIARTEDTAFLTKHLRAYGGDGVYDNNSIGRILRNLVFKAQGLVMKPANPNSIIFASVKDFSGVENNSVIQSTRSTKEMADNSVLEQENKSLKEQLGQLTAANKDLATKVTESSAKAHESKITSLEKDLADAKAALEAANKSMKDLTSKVESTEAVVKELNTKLETVTTEKTALASKLVEIEASTKLSERVSKLVSVGMKKEDAEVKAKIFAIVSDDVFETIASIAKVPTNNAADTQVLNSVKATETVVPNPGTKEHETATAALQDSVVKYLGSRTNKQSNKGDE